MNFIRSGKAQLYCFSLLLLCLTAGRLFIFSACNCDTEERQKKRLQNKSENTRLEHENSVTRRYASPARLLESLQKDVLLKNITVFQAQMEEEELGSRNTCSYTKKKSSSNICFVSSRVGNPRQCVSNRTDMLKKKFSHTLLNQDLDETPWIMKQCWAGRLQ